MSKKTWMSDPEAYLATLSIQTVPVDELSLNDSNANTHNAESIDAIARSIRRFGFQSPLVVQKQTNVVLAGEGRLLAAQQLGLAYVPVLYTTLVGVEAAAFAVADNRSAQLSSWNNEVLSGLLKDSDEATRQDMGFDEAAVARVIALGAFSIDEDEDEDDEDADGGIGFDDDARPDGEATDADPNGAKLSMPFVFDSVQHALVNRAVQVAREQLREAADGEDVDTSRAAALAHAAKLYLEQHDTRSD